jgi:hypothetical protein
VPRLARSRAKPGLAGWRTEALTFRTIPEEEEEAEVQPQEPFVPDGAAPDSRIGTSSGALPVRCLVARSRFDDAVSTARPSCGKPPSSSGLWTKSTSERACRAMDRPARLELPGEFPRPMPRIGVRGRRA